MRFSLRPLLTLIALAGCEDPNDLRPEPPQQSARLASGVYDLAMLEMIGTTCGARDSGRVGAILPAELRASGPAVELAIEGWRLRGDMGARNLYVEGGPSRPDRVVVDTDEDRDGDDPVESEEGAEGESTDGEAPPGGDSGRGETGAEELADAPEAPGGEAAPFASLDVRIQDAHFADGRLTVSNAGCEMDLHVTLTWRAEAPVEGRRGEERPPETEEPRDGDAPAEEGTPDSE